MEQDEWLQGFNDLKACGSMDSQGGFSSEFISWNDWRPLAKDLVVTSRKLRELENIIVQAQETIGLIVIHGPSGCGKHTALRSLCNNSGICLKEWRPSECSSHDFELYSYESEVSSLEKFLRNSCFESVQLDYDHEQLPCSLILIEPSYSFSNNCDRFCGLIKKYFSVILFSIVIVLDNSEQHKLCFKALERHICHPTPFWRLSFSALTNSSMKNLCRQIKNHFKISNRCWPKLKTLEDLIEMCMGDARKMLNQLYFHVRTSEFLYNRRKRDFVHGRKANKNAILTVFRALGKVFYAKRGNVLEDALLPLESSLKARSALITDPSIILKNMEVSVEFFSHMLFCNYPHFVLNIESLSIVSNFFCLWDIYMSCWNDVHHNLEQHKFSCTLFLSLSITNELAYAEETRVKSFFSFKSQDFFTGNTAPRKLSPFLRSDDGIPNSKNPNLASRFIIDDYSDFVGSIDVNKELVEAPADTSSVSIEDFSE